MHVPLAPPRVMYRQYLHALRHLPDPQVWAYLVPRFRKQLRKCYEPLAPIIDRSRYIGPETSAAAAAREAAKRRDRDVREARIMLAHARMTVACHPHAFTRTLQWAYGQRGPLRHQLMKSVVESCPVPDQAWPLETWGLTPQDGHYPPMPDGFPPPPAPCYPPREYQPLPPALLPIWDATTPQSRPERSMPAKRIALLKAASREAARKWDAARVPLAFPPGADARTGWEGRGVIESLRTIAGLDLGKPITHAEGYPVINPRELPTYTRLRPSLRAVLPRTFYRGSPPEGARFQRPNPGLVRDNPNTFGHPIDLTPRLITRLYRAFWNELRWTFQAVPKGPLRGKGEDKDVPPAPRPRKWVAGTYAEWVHGGRVSREAQAMEKARLTWQEVNEEERRWL